VLSVNDRAVYVGRVGLSGSAERVRYVGGDTGDDIFYLLKSQVRRYEPNIIKILDQLSIRYLCDVSWHALLSSSWHTSILILPQLMYHEIIMLGLLCCTDPDISCCTSGK